MNFSSIKKKLVSGLLVGTLLFSFGGATTAEAATSASEYLSQMNKALEKVKSYSIKQTMPMDMSMTAKAGDETQTMQMTLRTTSTQKTINKPKFKSKTVTKQTTTIDGQKTSTTQKVYIKKDKKGNLLSYTFIDNDKKPTKMNIDASQMNQLMKTINTDMLTNAQIIDDNFTLNKKNVVKLSAELDSSQLSKVTNELLNMGDISQLDEETQSFMTQLLDFSNVKPITFVYYIDKNTNLPVKCTADMADFLETYTQSVLTTMLNSELIGTDESMSMDIDVKKADVTVLYSNYNKVKDFKLPSSCK